MGSVFRVTLRHRPLVITDQVTEELTRSPGMSYYSPPSSGYGVPQAPPLDNTGNNNFYNGNNNPPSFSGGFYLYQGYEDDVYLLVKLGEASLVIFMILAVVSILYMITSCCLSVAKNK